MRSRWIVLLSAITLTACMTPPRPVAAPKEFIPANRPEQVWVDREGKTFIVLDPRIEGEALTGLAANGEDGINIPLSSLTEIRARQRDKTKTTAFVVAMTGLGVAGLVAAITQLNKGEGPVDPGALSDPGAFTPRGNKASFDLVPFLQYLRR
jgi:hypothetical protein